MYESKLATKSFIHCDDATTKSLKAVLRLGSFVEAAVILVTLLAWMEQVLAWLGNFLW
jgi:hypothetical protein